MFEATTRVGSSEKPPIQYEVARVPSREDRIGLYGNLDSAQAHAAKCACKCFCRCAACPCP